MERNSKKRRLSPFAAICILVSAAVLLLTALFIVRLNGYMEIYENAQPGRLAQQIYDTYYRGTPDYGKITEMAGCVLTSGESRDTLVRYLLEKQGGRELEMVRVSSAEKDTARYVLMAGDVKISAFNLRQGEEVRFSSLFGSFTKLLWLFSCYEWK
ncbi:MAG: hypothetical protein II797_01645, partial [Clostridia bacterium]|nr:hypothetical protein [Clostridia bacterium]